jgi:hypothetical protein
MRRPLKRVLATAAGTVALLSALSAPSASAGPATQVEPNGMSTQTHCIRVDAVHIHFFHNHVHLRNICSSSAKVKVIIAFDFDSKCYTIAGGSTLTHTNFGRFDGLVNC